MGTKFVKALAVGTLALAVTLLITSPSLFAAVGGAKGYGRTHGRGIAQGRGACRGRGTATGFGRGQ